VDNNTIDDLDRQLAHCLGVDGRASFNTIAEILGVSDQTVARRYRRLRSAGLLRVVGLRAKNKAGQLGWFLRMRCVPGSGEAIAAALARRPDTAWIQLLSGDTEVLCTLRGDGRDDGNSLLAKLPRSARIVEVTAYSLLHMYVGGPDALGFIEVLPRQRVEPLRSSAGPRQGESPANGGRIELGDLDMALFQALAVDGRTPYADLAASTGWSESTVRRRMDLLREAGVLYFDLEMDTVAFGLRSTTWLWMSVAPSQLAAAGEALTKFSEVAYAAATTGPANLVVCAVCRDESEFYEFLTAKAGSLPGVERVETAPVIRTVKQGSTVMMPGNHSPERSGPPARAQLLRGLGVVRRRPISLRRYMT
jgi:DNA-binding Lrp family transcriptional regulator